MSRKTNTLTMNEGDASETNATTNRGRAFISALAEILAHSNYRSVLEMYSRISMNCSRCSLECMVYEESEDPHETPCYRSKLLLRIYRRHFTPSGILLSWITGGIKRTERDIMEIEKLFYHCTACGRCSNYCPFGIDHRLILRLGRYILSEIGSVPGNLAVSVKEQLTGPTRNTSALPLKALIGNLKFLEEEIMDIKGVPVKFPIDVRDAEYVFFAPVSDYIMEAETLMGIACVLHEAGINWTIASENYDAINYGLFYSDARLKDIARNMIRAVKNLNGRKILIGECGHAYRCARDYIALHDTAPVPVEHVVELTDRLIKTKRISLDVNAVTEKLTFHDPCNIARSGQIVQQPRSIIRSFSNNFIEMVPHGTENYCCGGGGGVVIISELKEFRLEIAGKKKVGQLRETGADIVIAPCANCKKQLGDLIRHYKLPMQHAGIHDLVFRAIIMTHKD